MKFLRTLFCLLFLLGGMNAFAQDTLYYENFEASPTWLLDQMDVSSSGPSGYNHFIINNAYTGGSGSVICLGFPFNYTINNTPTQPGGVFNSPNSTYLHTISDAGIADNIFCSSYAAADGICYAAQNQFTKMNSDISTVGRTNVTLSFWWACSGAANFIYGQLYYSVNSGTSWTQVTSPLSNYQSQSSWVQQTISNAAWDNQATLRFGFRFVNNSGASSALDPGMSVDDIVVTGLAAASLTTDSVSQTAFCPGDPVTVHYTATGSFNPGNSFSAELSDLNGSFAAPTVIGSVSSTSSGNIVATIPLATPFGTAYRIRVVSSNPVVTGTDNGVDLTVHSLPEAGTASLSADTLCNGDTVMVSLAGSNGIVAWEQSGNGSTWSSTVFTGTSFNALASTDIWYRAVVSSPACGNDTSNGVHLTVLPPPVAGTLGSPTDSICEGDSLLYTLSGAVGSIYEWQVSTNGTNYSTVQTGSGTTWQSGPLGQDLWVQVQVSNDCGTALAGPVPVVVIANPVAAFSYAGVHPTVSFTDLSTGNPTAWNWDFGDGGTSTQQNPMHNYLSNGTYAVTLTVTNAAGCSSQFTDSVQSFVGLDPFWVDMDVRLWPNPSQKELFVQVGMPSPMPVEGAIYDYQGRMVASPFPIGQGQTALPTEGLAPGLYFLRLRAEGHSLSLRFVRLE